MGSSGGSGNTTSQASIAPELQPLFSQTGEIITDLQPQITGQFPEFFSPNVQKIPGFTGGQYDVNQALRQQALGGGLTAPQQDAYSSLTALTNSPVGSSPQTIAAMQAARTPIVNELAAAGLGNSGAVGTELAGAYAPILAQEMQQRFSAVPLLQQIGSAQYAQNMGGLSAYGASEEQQRQIAEARNQAEQSDFLRRQNLGSQFTTGILSGFPSITGQTSYTKSSGGGSVICTELRRRGLMDYRTYLADQEFGASLPADVVRGYHRWAKRFAWAMKRSDFLTKLIAPFALRWAREMRRRQYGDCKGSLIGKLFLVFGVPICGKIGRWGCM